jgi:hypothetical protein
MIIMSLLLDPMTCYIHQHWFVKHVYRRPHWILRYTALDERTRNAEVPATTDESKFFHLPAAIDKLGLLSNRFDINVP